MKHLVDTDLVYRWLTLLSMYIVYMLMSILGLLNELSSLIENVQQCNFD